MTSTTWELTIPGRPTTKGNSRRVMRRGKYLAVEHSEASVKAEYAARTVIAAHAPPGVFHGALRVDVEFRFSIPKSARGGPRSPPKLRPGDACLRHVDRGNCLKLIEDAMNGLVYEDDSQIVAGDVRKVWGERDETWVRVTAIGATSP